MLSILVVEIKILTETQKLLSVRLWGPFLTLHLCMFNPAHPSEGDPHPLQEGLIHTTVSHLAPQLFPTSPPFTCSRTLTPFYVGYSYLCLEEDVSSFPPYCKLLKYEVCALLKILSCLTAGGRGALP